MWRCGQEVRLGTAATLISLLLWCNLSTEHLLMLVGELGECIICEGKLSKTNP